MIYSNAQINNFRIKSVLPRYWFAAILLILLAIIPLFAQSVSQPDENTIVAEGGKVLVFGKNVFIPKNAEQVLVFGGDVVIDGDVDGDVAAIGGNVIQKQDAFIGGDVIVFGGSYKHERSEPLHTDGKKTIIIGGFEEELQDLARNPAQILSPQMTLMFFIQRILSILFWFVISLGITTIAPGAVSRSAARFQLSISKVAAIGMLGFLTFVFGVIGSLKFLPNYLGAVVSLMAVVLFILSYVFGRIILQVSVGKWFQKKFLPEKNQSETVALLIGAFVWTAILSLPYVWTFALFFLFIASLGIILTTRSTANWQKN